MSFNVYKVTDTELQHSGYKIKINGKEVKPDTARVSAMPFNRRWPGHQRSKDQSELVNFLGLETDEKLSFEITPTEPFEKVVIRPLSLGVEPEITSDGKILFTLERSAYFTVEPYGRHNALHIFADPISNYSIDKTDENVIYFGAGEHDAGMIYLQSNQTLFIDEGAVVYACVRASDAENIKILGRGILDNSKNKARILFEANEENNFAAIQNCERLHTVQIEYCDNVRIEGITMRDSLVYNIRPVSCKNVDIRNVKIIGCWRYNSDGIDMHNCEDVNIDNCFIRTFDDSICIKGFDFYQAEDVEKATREAMYHGGKSYENFKNVHISNCTVWNDWGKSLEIGAETKAEKMCNIVFEKCSVIHVTGAALDCTNVDYADVHDVIYRDIDIEFDETIPKPLLQQNDTHEYENTDPDFAPCAINVNVTYHKEYSAGVSRRGKNRNIRFENIKLHGRQKPKFRLWGYDDAHGVSDVTIADFSVNGKPLTSDGYTLEINEFCKNINIETV